MKRSHISIDLGTTNTVVALWNDRTDAPEIIQIENICRGTKYNKEPDDSFTIPSCVYLLPPAEALSFPFNFLFKKLKSKTGGLIGMQAIKKDGGLLKSRFVDNFKSYLGRNGFQLIAKMGKWTYSAHEITAIFLESLFLKMRKKMGISPGHLTFCVPVDFYEPYRAHLQRIASRLKVRKVKTIDEPIAAALGYGMSIEGLKHIIVIDFGAGTLDLALIRIEEKMSKKGKCTVIAKEGVPIGGNLIDAWIVEALCKHFNYNFDQLSQNPKIQWSYRVLLNEACRLKEALFFKDKKTFYFLPSKIFNTYASANPGNIRDLNKPVDFTRGDLVNLLEKKGLYSILKNLVNNLLKTAERKGVTENKIDKVLMVGGSTLLPNVYSFVEKRFGRDHIRAWQPFNAVAFGACVFAAGRFSRTDYITHDYAFVTYNKHTHEPEYQIIIPRGTVYPTRKDFWKRHLEPTCALGEPESIFKLVICEIGRKHNFDQEFIWDEKGDLHVLTGDNNKTLIIPLNESNPTLGRLDPPHYPSDHHARVEISFMVNEDKWLCTTVYDLKTGQYLLNEKPVIHLN